MNPLLTHKIVSGTSALLVTTAAALTLTFTLTAAPIASTHDQTANLHRTSADAATPADMTSATRQVIKLFKAGTSAQVLTSYVQASDQLFNVSADDILYLNKLGLPQDTIGAMLQSDRTNRQRLAAEQAEVESEAAGAHAPSATYSEPPTGSPAPDGYTDSGVPYYYVYPSDNNQAATSSENNEVPPPDIPAQGLEGYGDDGYLAPYYAPWGWDWGWGVPFGFDFDNNRHHHGFHRDFNKGFNRNFNGAFNHNFNGGFNHNFSGRSSFATPHQSFGGSRMAFGGHTGGGHGGGHR